MCDEAKKTTLMILNVDLQCRSCYKKVKKVLCKFPQIRDQRYNEKENKVFITVVCCDPEKIRDKLCCKGCGVIKSIEIVKPPKQKPPPKEPDPPKPPPPKEPDPPKPPPPKQPDPPKPPPPKEPPKKPEDKPPPPPPKTPEREPVTIIPCYPEYPPRGFCCGPCSAGIPGGPCYSWYDRPPPPPPPPPRPCYEPFYGCRCGQVRGYYGCRCDYNYSYCQDSTSCALM